MTVTHVDILSLLPIILLHHPTLTAVSHLHPLGVGSSSIHFLSARSPSTTTWHHVVSFNPTVNTYLRNLQKGSQVYVEANFELREPVSDADPDTPQGQRQIFLRHGETVPDRTFSHNLIEFRREYQSP